MQRVFCWLFVVGLTISTIGCGGNSGPVAVPEDTGQAATEEPEMSGNDLEVPPIGTPPP